MKRNLPIPECLEEDENKIHERMLEKAPPGVSTIEGDFFWDTTRPIAEEKAHINTRLFDILKLAFPQTSEGIYLEYLGEERNVFKNPATYSTGIITVKGKPGVTIEKGRLVGTIATDEKPSIEFEFTETKSINDTGSVCISAKCTEKGIVGNVEPNNITIAISPINGVESITNEENFKGGTEIEDEEHFRERVINAEKEDKLSGADSDYVAWAKEVDGVGYAYTISEWNGPGTVKVLILDKNRQPATKDLIDDVQKYIAPIVPKGQNRKGKAPTGAIVTIATSETLNVKIKAKFNFKEGFNRENVLNDLKIKLNNYLANIDIGGTIVYNAIHTIIGSIILTGDGLEDFSNLTVNDVQENIKLIDQVAVVTEVINIE